MIQITAEYAEAPRPAANGQALRQCLGNRNLLSVPTNRAGSFAGHLVFLSLPRDVAPAFQEATYRGFLVRGASNQRATWLAEEDRAFAKVRVLMVERQRIAHQRQSGLALTARALRG